MVTAILFYDVVLWIHIAAIVAGFGALFALPIMFAVVRGKDRSGLPALHEAAAAVHGRLTGFAMLVALIAGIYLASKNHLWDRSWVTVPLVILIVLGGLTGGVLAPRERKAAQLARGASADYDRAARTLTVVTAVCALLVIVAAFFMTTKPGGY